MCGMKKLLIIVLGVSMFMMSACQAYAADARAIVDRIEGNCAVAEFSNDDTINMVNIHLDELNFTVAEEAELPIAAVNGKIYHEPGDMYYLFHSDDNTVWWALTLEEIGFIPNSIDIYTLYYSENGTTMESQVCDCLPEWDCECYLYDDIFFHIEKLEEGV